MVDDAMIAGTLEVGPNIVAVIVLIMPAIMLLAQAFILFKTNKIHGEVKTINGLQMGQLADAAETRRIAEIPTSQRTTAEAAHVAAVPLPPHAVDIRDIPIGEPPS